MRYAYAITAALLAGGAAATLTLQPPAGAQVAQNAGASASAPRGGPPSFADLAQRLMPAVVNISTTQRVKVQQAGGGANPFAGTPFEDMFRGFGGGGGGGSGRPTTREATSLGSGFLISADGYIVTNNHVITGGPEGADKGAVIESITVTLQDRTEFKAKLIGRDAAADLAVLKIDAAKPFPFVQFGDSTRTRVGDWVMAIGQPFALGGTVTAGIVSAIHRSISGGGAYDRYIQTDAAINSGNSGGPLFDLAGNVVGINNAIYSPSGGNVGIGFAIPAEQAKPIVEVLRKGGRVKRGYLGIGIQPISDDIATALNLPKNHGELVRSVEPGYAAARAGIQQGDVVTKVNGEDVTPDNTLSYVVSNLPIGSRVPIELYRRGQKTTVTAVIGERPPESQLQGQLGGDSDDDAGDDAQQGNGGAGAQGKAAASALGASLQALTPQIAQQLGVPATTRGVVIASTDPDSDLATNGVKRGDIIVSINQTPTPTVAAAAAQIDAAKRAGRDTVLLFVQRGNQPAAYLGVKLKK